MILPFQSILSSLPLLRMILKSVTFTSTFVSLNLCLQKNHRQGSVIGLSFFAIRSSLSVQSLFLRVRTSGTSINFFQNFIKHFFFDVLIQIRSSKIIFDKFGSFLNLMLFAFFVLPLRKKNALFFHQLLNSTLLKPLY